MRTNKPFPPHSHHIFPYFLVQSWGDLTKHRIHYIYFFNIKSMAVLTGTESFYIKPHQLFFHSMMYKYFQDLFDHWRLEMWGIIADLREGECGTIREKLFYIILLVPKEPQKAPPHLQVHLEENNWILFTLTTERNALLQLCNNPPCNSPYLTSLIFIPKILSPQMFTDLRSAPTPPKKDEGLQYLKVLSILDCPKTFPSSLCALEKHCVRPGANPTLVNWDNFPIPAHGSCTFCFKMKWC